MVTGDSQEEVLIFRDKQTLHHNIYIVTIIDIAVSRRRSRGSPLSNIFRREELLLQERVYRRGDFWVSRRSPGAGRRRRRRRKGRRARSRRIRKRRRENSHSFRDQPLP